MLAPIPLEIHSCTVESQLAAKLKKLFAVLQLLLQHPPRHLARRVVKLKQGCLHLPLARRFQTQPGREIVVCCYLRRRSNLGPSGPRAASKRDPGESFALHKFENLDVASHSNLLSCPPTQVVRSPASIFWLVASETTPSPKRKPIRWLKEDSRWLKEETRRIT